jgi:hypothetical protein
MVYELAELALQFPEELLRAKYIDWSGFEVACRRDNGRRCTIHVIVACTLTATRGVIQLKELDPMLRNTLEGLDKSRKSPAVCLFPEKDLAEELDALL